MAVRCGGRRPGDGDVGGNGSAGDLPMVAASHGGGWGDLASPRRLLGGALKAGGRRVVVARDVLSAGLERPRRVGLPAEGGACAVLARGGMAGHAGGIPQRGRERPGARGGALGGVGRGRPPATGGVGCGNDGARGNGLSRRQRSFRDGAHVDAGGRRRGGRRVGGRGCVEPLGVVIRLLSDPGVVGQPGLPGGLCGDGVPGGCHGSGGRLDDVAGGGFRDVRAGPRLDPGLVGGTRPGNGPERVKP